MPSGNGVRRPGRASVAATTARFVAARLASRLRRRSAPVSPTAFRAAIEATLERVGDAVAGCDWRTVGPTADGWVDSQVTLTAGEAVTLLATGRLTLSRLLDVAFGPTVGLWYRVGDGPIAKVVGDSDTFRCERGGTLWLSTKPPGEFLDRTGAFDPAEGRSGIGGGFTVAIVRWSDAETGLTAAAAADARWFGPARRRLAAPVDPPAGWHYLWRLGPGEIYREQATADGPALCCHSAGDVGILQFPVDEPLTDETVLSWSWCVERLPSRLPEHTQPTHDYLSIAVEFDNGLDLTYMWSAALPVDTVFRCPLPWWKERETHWVVRTGHDELGRWVDDRRTVRDDYARAIGGPLPERIVAVWLIANTVFGREVGECRYRRIALEQGAQRVAIGA
ncbi:hypothetical protein PAI11_16040 [Patulibacter medicamentivorans]|uniref:DUF3047 domain-containing protein n=1 Tax=Patulibacter medicamentivorans TaxID=1097667 RepID=H0E477_9ACTN|nr:DUF3047 domain-containing protein [Patulibacter medicamentivorans]EHN11519.1 hypothetical protein PAI11_16040 [Patulibacter medicamentivorans]